MSSIVTTPTCRYRSWVWVYKRPPRMGWPIISVPNPLNRDREPYRVAPKEIEVTVHLSRTYPQPTATTVRVSGTGDISTSFTMHLPGTERFSSHRGEVPDWMMEIVHAAEQASVAEMKGKNHEHE